MAQIRLRTASQEAQQNESATASKNETSSNNETGTKSDNLLISVSIDLIYDGMVVLDDIYDSSGERKLISSGNKIDELQIERIKRLNSGHSTIVVTGRTHQTMLSKRPDNVEIDVRSEVEESTGYSNTVDKTFKRLEEIVSDKNVDAESLKTVTDDLTEQLNTLPQGVVMFLINAMAPVDEYLQRHCVNVGMLNGLCGRWLGMSDTEIERLVMIGFIHDTGKIVIPPRILNAPRKLTTVEYEIIKTHASHTYDLLFEFPEDIRIAASSHHERLNGTGYTKSLSKDAIPIEARITAVADTYDAIVARRAYQGPQSPFNALALLKKLSENELDGNVVRAFIENIPQDLIGKTVMMSNGNIGIIRDFDTSDIAYPMIELSGKVIKCSDKLYCESMFSDD